MRRGRGFLGWTMVWVAVIAVASSGCGDDAFAPPPPELRVVPSSTTKAPARVVALILPSDASVDRDTWTIAAQSEAAESRAVLRVERPAPTDVPAVQAELVRAAARNKVTAIVIEPNDAPEVGEALRSAVAQGIPVVLLGKTLSGPDAATPFHVVTYGPYDDAIKALIQGVKSEARASALSPEGHAILLHNTEVGPICDQSVERIRDAIMASGVPRVETIFFKGKYEEAVKGIDKALEVDPDITMVFATDPVGLSAANAAATKVKQTRGLAIGGCQTVDRLYVGTNMPDCAGVIDRNISALARLAFDTAVRLSRGESVPTSQVLPIKYVPNTFAGAAGVQETDSDPASGAGQK